MTVHTGDALLDRFQTPLQRIVNFGWKVDATPGFSSLSESEGRQVAAWAQTATKTVWIWPERISSKPRGSEMWLKAARKLIWHELGHVHWFSCELHVAWWQRIRGFRRPATMTDAEYRGRLREDHAETYARGAFTGDTWQNIGFTYFNKDIPTAAEIKAARRTEPV